MLSRPDCLEYLKIQPKQKVYYNLSKPVLIEHAIQRNEAVFSDSGAILVDTGIHTGRSAGDKYIVNHANTSDLEIAWGAVNRALSAEKFDNLLLKVQDYLASKDIYVQDVLAGRDENYSVSFRIITEKAWSALFSCNLLRQIDHFEMEIPDFSVLHVPDFFADPETDGTTTGTFIILDFEKKVVLIGGTSYAGEIKKSVFTVMNRILPNRNVFPMHCSANVGKQGDTALFFGLSGTGKTTLSSSKDRYLIGDDEHGWSEAGIFNFEAGCYAKTIKLSQEQEPLIWEASHRFGTVLENVGFDPLSRRLDFSDCRRTENTRSAYPLEFIPGHVKSGQGGHPQNIFFLSADAFGVLPPISLLTAEQAVFYFLLGYTAKLAGTEKGLGSEPQATFSACFGEPFLPLSPIRYAEILSSRIKQFQPQMWLINTGWIGGRFGVGSRIKLKYSRSMIQAALLGNLSLSDTHTDCVFGLQIPNKVSDVPVEVLDPASTWTDQAEYSKTANKLINQMYLRMEEYKNYLPSGVLESGPKH